MTEIAGLARKRIAELEADLERWRQVLALANGEPARQVTTIRASRREPAAEIIERIIDVVAGHYRVGRDELLSQRSTEPNPQGGQTVMADSLHALPDGSQFRYKDSGDGTVAMTVAQVGAITTSNDGTSTVAIPAGTITDTVVKATAGRLCRILVTTLGANALQVCDNATAGTGTVIGALTANAPIGTYSFQMPAAAGITVAGNAANPAVTISYA